LSTLHRPFLGIAGSHSGKVAGQGSLAMGGSKVQRLVSKRSSWPIVRFFQRRADPDRAAASCTALVTAPASAIDGRHFDGRKPHPLPRRVLDPDLRERLLRLGQDLADRAAR
jgi:hypothetical protein